MSHETKRACPNCGEANCRRIPKKWYMQIIPGAKRYRCSVCRQKFVVIFGKPL